MTNLNPIKNILQSVDWQRDHGLRLDMLNDCAPTGRSAFYDKLFASEVHGKHCVDIGFGTGLLSMLALKHNAKHISAWEQDPCVYQIGQYIIKELGLENKITLAFGRFDHSVELEIDDVIFHEIIGTNIWSEGMRDCLNSRPQHILPGSCRVEFDLLEISQEDWQRLLSHSNQFTPSIEFIPGYTQLLQSMILATPRKIANRAFWQQQYIKNQLLARWDFYDFDFNSNNNIPAEITKSFYLPKTNNCLILYPHMFVAHNGDELEWSWSDPLLIGLPHSDQLQVTQHLDTGRMFFKLID